MLPQRLPVDTHLLAFVAVQPRVLALPVTFQPLVAAVVGLVVSAEGASEAAGAGFPMDVRGVGGGEEIIACATSVILRCIAGGGHGVEDVVLGSRRGSRTRPSWRMSPLAFVEGSLGLKE